jgi:hypothetical protein
MTSVVWIKFTALFAALSRPKQLPQMNADKKKTLELVLSALIRVQP